ncbi:sugar-binding domain-containing protein [Flavobacterium sp. 3HN19-14]|uniref:sugar-binding domain-containing protein n=1 Tax=Flavobacterium sp. 3HN19-14 TaxID=3448133 RepID=UPI003EE03BE4
MKIRCLLPAIFLISFSFFAQNPRQKTDFDEGWKFHFGSASNPEKDFNYSIATVFSKSGNGAKTAIDPKFVDTTWTNVNLPHDWAVDLPFVNVNNFDVQSHGFKPVGGLFPETSIGWYRKHFTVSKPKSGGRLQLQFDGIYRNANVWVNGFFLGNNQSGYLGINYDITDFVNYDADNVVVVRVDATQYEGWFYEGAGIYRHVWLNEYQNLHIADDGIFAYAKATQKSATVTMETDVMNENFADANYAITAFLKDRNGKTVASSKTETVKIGINETKKSKQNISVSSPKLWSLENPYLYKVVVEIKQSGKITDSKTVKFGIRTVEIKKNGVF